MKIVYCIAGTYRGGGMERVLALKANWLAKHGYDVSIVTTDQCGRDPFFDMDSHIALYDLGIGYEDNNGGSFIDKLIHYPQKKKEHRDKLSQLLNKIKPDICVSMFCGEASFLPDLKDGSKKVAEVHFSRFKRLQYGRKGLFGVADKLLTWSDGRIAARFDRFVVLTEEDRPNWGNSHKVQVIGNPLTFSPDIKSTLDEHIALSIGRFTHQKAFDRLIAVWQLVALKKPDWELHIVGDGELKSDLERQIEKAGLDKTVKLIPPTKDIASLYAGASMYLMTSRYEGLPMVLIEAQSYGLPIISMACKCGPKDVVTNGINGFLIEEGDVTAMAEQICSLIEDANLRKKMGTEAKKASCRFEMDSVMSEWDKLFNDIVNEK